MWLTIHTLDEDENYLAPVECAFCHDHIQGGLAVYDEELDKDFCSEGCRVDYVSELTNEDEDER